MDSEKQKIPYLEQYIIVTTISGEIIRLFYPYIVGLEAKQYKQLQYYNYREKQYVKKCKDLIETNIKTRDGKRHYVIETIEQIMQQTTNF